MIIVSSYERIKGAMIAGYDEEKSSLFGKSGWKEKVCSSFVKGVQR